MKRNKSIILSALIVVAIQLSCMAQSPTIGVENFFKNNIEYPRKGYAPSAENIKMLTNASGINQIWDLRFLTNESIWSYDTLKIIPMPLWNPYYSYYDTSNVFIQTRKGYTAYHFCFLKQSDTVFYVGSPKGTIEAEDIKFSGNFVKELINNTSYGASYTEKFEGEWYDASGGGKHYIKNGIIETNADGYGKIIYPDGDTVQNVLRIKKLISYLDSTDINWKNQYFDTLYSFYSSNYSCPVLNLHTGFCILNGNYFTGENPLILYELNESQRVSVPETSVNPYPINIYAVNNNIMINIGNPELKTVSACIFDITGRSVKNVSLHSGSNTINMAEFSDGLYFAVVKSENNILKTTKLIVN